MLLTVNYTHFLLAWSLTTAY